MRKQLGFLGCGPRRVLGLRVGSYVVLPGATADFIGTPDSGALDVTGDLDLRYWGSLASWAPASIAYLITKFTTAGQISYLLSVTAAGALQLEWSADGSTVLTATSTAMLSIAAGAVKRVRVAVDVDNAGVYNVFFYTSDDGNAWTQLGSTIVGGATTSFFSSTSNVNISGFGDGLTGAFAGRVLGAEVRNGIDGTIVAAFNPADAAPGARVVRSKRTGEVWTLNGAAVVL